MDRRAVQTAACSRVTTWAGALPFEAVRDGWESQSDWFIAQAVRDRVDDLDELTRANPPAHTGAYALVGATRHHRHRRAADRERDDRDPRRPHRGRRAVGIDARAARRPVRRREGQTIVPGLWDMHAHAWQTDWAPVYLASGVTTIRDMGGEEAFLVAIRDAIDSGKALGPRYLLAGLVDAVRARTRSARSSRTRRSKASRSCAAITTSTSRR